MASNSRIQLEAWLSKKFVTGKVLDVGGAQEPLKGRIGEAGVVEYRILDLPEPHEVKVTTDIKCDLNVGLSRDQVGHYWEYFDTVACLEVTEYFWNPVFAIENMSCFLKKGGRLLISFHFAYPVHAPEGLDYLRYTDYGAKKILEECGFKIVSITPRMAGEYKVYPLDVFNNAEKNHPLKRYDHKRIGCLIEAIKL